MKRINLYVFCVFALFSLEATGQNLSEILNRFAQEPATTIRLNNFFQGDECEPDSIYAYGFTSPSDSILGQRQIFRKYGDLATTVYTYEGQALFLYSIDSTAFNSMGNPVFNEYWEFNSDSNAVVIKERLFCFPHEGAVQSVDILPQSLLRILQPKAHTNVAFDSVILHTKNFFTGLIEPNEKTVNLYSPSGQLQEIQVFNWDPFGTMSWLPSSKTNYYYTITDRIDYTEEYQWGGIDFILAFKSDYTYDANDSLTTIIKNDELAGLPFEKLEVAYNTIENTISVFSFRWDESGSQWDDTGYVLGDYDDMDRLEILELVFTFFGSTEGSRLEYVYVGNGPCPWYFRVYEYLGGTNWDFIAKYYYFPSVITSTFELEVLEWSVYPNPTEDGIWVVLPPGTYLQISTLQGKVLYRGFTKDVKEYIDLKQTSRNVLVTVGQGKAAVSRMVLVYD